ncbi:MAG: lipid-A-disaccharide synthase N-terminal domain-containing protein [Syntrophobacteraceae bacterium]|nr:lipid-A-disaccharide synthase N-terminal domain-containing protein [Syntrophobacteraceae bacterium]
MNAALNDPVRFLATHSLLILGFLGQGLFFGRFLVQWIASEKQRRSVVPVPFWYFSIGGGGLLLIYAVLKKDPVFILGQAGGLLIYLRNLALIFKERARVHAATGSTRPVSSPE